MVAVAGNILPKTDATSIDLEAIANEIPDGGMAYRSFGDLAHLYEELDPKDAEIDLSPIVDMIAQGVIDDFAKWDAEMDSASPSPHVVINRNDAVGAITLWETHPSENTEAAARHILHYAAVTTPATKRQDWSEAYFEAFKLMVEARSNKEHDDSLDLLSLTTALRQYSSRRRGAEAVKNYDNIFVENDN